MDEHCAVQLEQFSPVQFSLLIDCVIRGRERGHDGRFRRDPLLVFFSAGGRGEQFWHGQGCPLFDIVHPAFPLPTIASPTLQGTLKDDSREVAVTCDMLERCELPSLDGCHEVPVGSQGS